MQPITSHVAMAMNIASRTSMFFPPVKGQLKVIFAAMTLGNRNDFRIIAPIASLVEARIWTPSKPVLNLVAIALSRRLFVGVAQQFA